LRCDYQRGRRVGPREAEKALATNARATEIVLAAAVGATLDPIVHVSSYVALLPSRDVLRSNSPIGVGAPAYPRSKVQSELIARRHQARGAPVVTTYPGAVAGPHDPYFGDTAFTIAMILQNRMPFALPGGWPVADVGYVANAHAAMLQPGRGPRRYLLGGHYRLGASCTHHYTTSPGVDSPPSRRLASSPGPAAERWTASSQ
jgi:dihydroflavonol-4-reductase